jgi:hypothetical protein
MAKKYRKDGFAAKARISTGFRCNLKQFLCKVPKNKQKKQT